MHFGPPFWISDFWHQINNKPTQIHSSTNFHLKQVTFCILVRHIECLVSNPPGPSCRWKKVEQRLKKCSAEKSTRPTDKRRWFSASASKKNYRHIRSTSAIDECEGQALDRYSSGLPSRSLRSTPVSAYTLCKLE